MWKPLLLLLLLFIINANQIEAQNFYSASEYGVLAGGSQYFGDLNDNYGFKAIKPAMGLLARHHFNPYLSIRIAILGTQLGYDDKFNTNYYQKARNLNFKSTIVESAVQGEFNFFRFETGNFNHRITPYLTFGIGAFYYNPYTYLNGKKYYLRKLGTEGQFSDHPERKYSHIAACFPIGVGFKYWIRPGFNFAFEIANRLTTTDYIDDVSTTYVGSDKFPVFTNAENAAYYLQDRSTEIAGNTALGRAGKQRGNSVSTDQYLMALFTLSFQLKVYRCPSWLKEGFYMY